MIALDATYSIGGNITGVGVYSRELLDGLAADHPECGFLHCYRPHRYLRSLGRPQPGNVARRLLQEPLPLGTLDLFHGLNQRLPRMRLRRRVTTFHDLFVLTGDYSTPDFRRRFAAMAREAASGSDLIICVSAFTATQVEQLLGVPPARLRVVHHGVRTPAVTCAARERIILHVGAIQKRKNIARLVEAFRAMDGGWRLVLAGSAGYGAGEILDAIAGDGRITVTGYLSAAGLQQWYGRAMILAFPSLDEGFGLPVLEAMAAGVAVITSKRSALPEVAGDAALLVDPESTDSIVQALRSIATDGNLRNTLVQKGYQRAAAFCWTEAVRKTWEVYRELVD